MKLLICTQTVDKNNPILGFFHGWIEEFAKHFEDIEVICLKEGFHQLPENVSVHSLDKESGENRIKYIVRFYTHLLSLRGKYDRVFVHMNPHYVLLGGWYWKLNRVPVFFWRNHAKMNLMTEIAAKFAKRVFYTSPFACTSTYSHAIQMPVGIDHTKFTPGHRNNSGICRILFLGRLSPVKRAEIFIDAGKHLPGNVELHVYGDAPKKDRVYGEAIKAEAAKNTFFHPSVKNEDTPQIYQAHDVYVNLTPEGSMDKTVLEAAACGVPVIVANTSFSKVFDKDSLLKTTTGKALAESISSLMRLPAEARRERATKARQNVIEQHSLEKLGIMLRNYLHEQD
jgi:glycosyltransferase involved in cell wall biosynthesis